MFFRQTCFLFYILFILTIIPNAFASPVVIPYDGNVSSEGMPVYGNGIFKFAILDNMEGARHIIWLNSNCLVENDECVPENAVTVPVSNGNFFIKLGDVDIANMNELTEDIFSNQTLFLRVWFDDGVNGFQMMAPDVEIFPAPSSIYVRTADKLSTSAQGADSYLDAYRLDGKDSTDFALFNNPHLASDITDIINSDTFG